MNTEINPRIIRNQIRLWPGIILAIVLWVLRFVLPYINPELIAISVFGGMFLSFAIILWWMFFSKVSLFDRITAPVLMAVALITAGQFLDKSIETAMMGMMFILYSIPVLCIAFVGWALVTRNFSERIKRITMVFTIGMASGIWVILRTNGMSGEAHHDFAWRWAKTAEEQLLVSGNLKSALDSSSVNDNEPEWPGFRGPNRDSKVHDIKINTDWKENPPVELWRRKVGPGCSSFAVQGNLLYTQEQRGENEMVTCYNIISGEPVWQHSDSARFWDSHAGAGPRSTPTLFNGRVYSQGATGILNVLDADSGTLIWSRDIANETKTTVPKWGFCGSPLVVNNLVIVSQAGSLFAYNINTSDQRWAVIAGGDCYSSPHFVNINGTGQIMILNENGASAYFPENGKLLWEYKWKGNPILQPAVTSEGEMLISISAYNGVRHISFSESNFALKIKEGWTSSHFKPNHNDFVIHKGYAYGMDPGGLTCIDTHDGSRKWKGKRYGGQLILLVDQDLLLILAEKGEVALVKAVPEKFEELAQLNAIKGKTWNHPVLAGDVLLVRNSEEMAAFRLTLL